MHNQIKHLIVLALFIVLPQAVHGQDSTAFTMDSLVVHHGASPHLNDTINMIFAFKSNIAGTAVIHLHFPGSVAPPNQLPGETQRVGRASPLDTIGTLQVKYYSHNTYL